LETNRTYKNDFFQKVFEDKERLMDVVRLFTGKDATEVEISNVSPVLLGNKENDLSFIVDEALYFMVEAQSTPNPNMPFRILHYIAEGLLKFVDGPLLYSKNLVPLKVPKLYTLFTGITKEIPESIIGELRLSTAFEQPQQFPDLEVIVHTYDFNMTVKEIEDYLSQSILSSRLQQFEGYALFWYALFANCVDYHYKELPPGQEGEKVQALYQLCELFRIRGIFTDLFNDSEVVNMTVMEFSRENELIYTGLEKGIQGSIELLAEVGVSKQEAVEKIAVKYALTTDAAKRYVAEYYTT